MISQNTQYGHKCCEPLHIQNELIQLIRPYYDQAHRFYHTIEHIFCMYKDACFLEIDLTCEEMIAIAYHDIIWFANDDQQSVLASGHMLKTHKHLGLLDRVADIIDTEPYTYGFDEVINGAVEIVYDTHKHLPNSTNIDSSRVIDLDMFGFSQCQRQPETLAQLRKEYGPNFETGRMAFLQSMLSRKPFFYTLHDEYNRLAYTNILNEMQETIGVKSDDRSH